MSLTIASLAPVKIGSTTLAAMSVNLPPNIADQFFQHSGNEFPSVGVYTGATPRWSFQTPAKAALDAIGLKFSLVTAAEIYLATFASALRGSGSTHSKWALSTSAKAVVWISSVSARPNGIAMATVEVMPLSADGIAHPLTRTDSVALPTLSSEPAVHTMGPVQINGSRIDGATGISYAGNCEIVPEITDGDKFPKVAAFMGAKPQLSIEHADPLNLLAAMATADGNDGNGIQGAYVASATGIYFRAIDATTQLPLATGLSLLMSSGRITSGPVQLSLGAPATSGLTIHGMSATTTHPVAYATSATLP